MRPIPRRRFLAGASLLPLVGLLPRRLVLRALAATGPPRFFDDHQAAVIREAAARLVPGPQDDPLEAGHPGAREAEVVRYVDTMLSAFSAFPPMVHAGGPFSDRAGGTTDDMARFVALSPVQELAWRSRVASLQAAYSDGVAQLDALAGGDFTAATGAEQDAALTQAAEFRDVLFTHAVEGMYAVPEYGGNAGLAGWLDIRFPGDRQPAGYGAEQVGASDGPDPVANDPIVQLVIQVLGATLGAVFPSAAAAHSAAVSTQTPDAARALGRRWGGR